jgi:hypothetical protein
MTTEPSCPTHPAGEAGHLSRGHSVAAQVVAGWRWVRLAHTGQPRYFVTLKMAPDADENDAVWALEWWLRSPGREDGDVIEVS